ncbi:MAG: hypothetical protein HOC74_16670 [Gemmatimonadetes bacterium]|nr:hypothetical protein [Gemmatimonadota bacterium]
MLRRFLWVAYDHLGGLVLFNLVWTGLSLPWLLLGALLLGAGSEMGGGRGLAAVLMALELVLVSPPTLLLFLAARRWVREEEVGFGQLLAEWRRFAWRAQALGILTIGATCALVVNVFFYHQFASWVGLALSGLMLWFLLGVALIGLYLFPVLIAQEGSVWQTIRQSFLLVIDNVRLSLGLLLGTGFSFGIGVVSGLGLFCGMLTALVLFVSIGFRSLLPKYTGESLPEGPRRSWRELIRPWES